MGISLNGIGIVLLIGALQGLFLCVPLLAYKNNRAPNRILAVFVVLLASDLVFAYLNNSAIVLRHPHLYNLNASLPFLFTPVMYLYVSVITGQIARLRARHLAHALPFISHLLFMSARFYALSAGEKKSIIETTLSSGRIIDRMMLLLTKDGTPTIGFVALCAIALSYVALIVMRVIGYRKELGSFYSDIRNKMLGLLYICAGSAIAIWGLVIFLLARNTQNHLYPMLLYTAAIYAGAYKMATMPEIFSANSAMNTLLLEAKKTEDRPYASAIEKFQTHMLQSKAYLNPELTIADVSGKIDVPVHQLSKALNLGLKKNFYQCVNELRVEEAKRMLTDKRYSDTSILTIALDAGFNSKSAFNEAFKRIVRETPSEYRHRAASG